MTVLEFSGLIAALAFTVLVVFVVIFIVQLIKSLKIITKHTESLAIESNQLLDQVNLLASDVNAKSSALDPAVKAIADLGSSVSNVQGTISKTNQKKDDSLLGSLLSSGAILSVARIILKMSSKKK